MINILTAHANLVFEKFLFTKGINLIDMLEIVKEECIVLRTYELSSLVYFKLKLTCLNKGLLVCI